ncbi:MAG: hypothetical protein WCX88_00380 [Patescibacteria group bacterium]
MKSLVEIGYLLGRGLVYSFAGLCLLGAAKVYLKVGVFSSADIALICGCLFLGGLIVALAQEIPRK